MNQTLNAIKKTVWLRSFGLFKVPLIFAVGPKVLQLDAQRAAVLIPLNRFTRNHLKSMYFGTLCIGADCSAGAIAMHLAEKDNKNISLVFKDLNAQFLRRPDGDVLFVCEDGPQISLAIEAAHQTGLRQNCTVSVNATVPSISKTDVVAKFSLTLSLKSVKK